MAKQCKKCWEGEHENYDEDIRLTAVFEPDTGRQVARCNMCGEHRAAYHFDGYEVEII